MPVPLTTNAARIGPGFRLLLTSVLCAVGGVVGKIGDMCGAGATSVGALRWGVERVSGVELWREYVATGVIAVLGRAGCASYLHAHADSHIHMHISRLRWNPKKVTETHSTALSPSRGLSGGLPRWSMARIGWDKPR